MSKLAFITGASSGIGRATAVALANLGMDLILCGRRLERLHELKEFLAEKEIRIHLLTFDVRDKESINRAIDNLPECRCTHPNEE